jgi:hypothetical protein
MKTLLFTACFFISIQSAFSQFNDTINYYVHYGSTGIINKTNDGKAYVLNNSLRFNVSKKAITVNTTNNWTFGKQRAVLTNNDFLSGLDFNLYKTLKHFYYWGMGNYEKSFSLKINHRLQAGLGIGYNVIDRKNAVVILSDGILYEKSDLYDTEAEGTNKYETFRNSFRLKFRILIKDIATIDGSDFLQHSLRDKSDYIIKSSTNLSLKIRKWLSLTTSVNYNKMNITSRETLFINYGLSIEKYF